MGEGVVAGVLILAGQPQKHDYTDRKHADYAHTSAIL